MKNTEKIIVGYDAENQNADNKIVVGYDAENTISVAPEQAEKPDRAFLRAEEFGIEDKTLRTANARHYITSNGERKAVITATPRHYYSEADKRMRKIDNTLELKNGVYENKYNGFKVRFAEDASAENLMRVEKDGYEITFALADNVATGDRMLRSGRRGCHAVLHGVKARMADSADDKLESGIDYPELFDGVDFEYEVKPDKIKENIKIEKRLESYEFVFVVSAKGLRLETNAENNTIEFYPENAYSENAEPVFTMPAPYMFDGNGETSYAVKYFTERISADKYLLKIQPDAQWINAEERAFPVTVDPTVVSSGSQFIYKIVPDYSEYQSSSKFYRTEAGCQQIGYYRVNSSTTDNIFGETYLYFELNSATRSKLAHISNAVLDIPIYLSPYVTQANGYFALYATNDSKWKDSSIDWKNNEPTTEYEIIGSAKPYKNNKDNKYHLVFDVTGALRSGYTGFVIKGNHMNDFYNGRYRNSIYVPKEGSNSGVSLTISYLQDGYLRGGKSISQSCNMAGNGSVDLFTGALTYVIDILKLDGTPLPIDISLVYNSNRKNELGLNGYTYGEGWMFNFMQSIKRISKAPYTSYKGDNYHECYEYTDAFGNKQEIDTRYYTYRGDKSYKRYQPYDGDTGVFAEISNDNFVLTKDPNSDNIIILTDKTGKKLKFVSGILASIEMPGTYYDNVAPKLEITYNNGTIKLKDSRGREAELIFKSMAGIWFFTGVKYNGETICSIDNTGALITPYGKASFDYSGGCLKKITDGTGYTLEYKTQFTNNKFKVTGYTIKSSVAEISYNADSNNGSVASSTTKILEDVTIEYDSQITEGRLGGYGNMDNLTAVSNAAGAKTYYYFNSDGMALAVIDGKGNMEVNSMRSEYDESNYSSTVIQKTARALYSAETERHNSFDSPIFLADWFNEENSMTLISNRNAQKGWYIFAVCLTGLVASGKPFNTIAEANEKSIPYLALKIAKTYNNGGAVEEDFVRVDSCATGSSKKTMAFLPYYVGDNVGSINLKIVTMNNPNPIQCNYMTVLKAAQGTSVTVNDTDKSVTESYKNGLYTQTTSDITKLKNNTRKIVTQRGTASEIETTITYDSISLSDNSKVFPERVAKEEDQYLKRTYTHDNCSNVTSEEIQDKSTSKIMRREYTYSNSNTALKNNNAPLSETDEDGNTYKYEYTGAGYLKRMTFPPIREVIPGTYFPGQDIDYAYSGIDGLLQSITTPARNDVGECENKFSYNLGYLTKLNHFGCEYKFKYDGFGRMTEITVGGELYSKTAYTDNGTDIDGVSGATSKTVTAYYDGTYIQVPYCGRANCGDGSASSVPTAHAFASYYDKYGELIKVRYATDVTPDHAFSETDDYVTVEEINEYSRFGTKYTIGTSVYEVDYDKTTGELLKRTEYENNNEKLKLEITDHDGFGRVSGMKYSLDCMEAQTYKYAYKSNYDDGIKTVTLPNGKTDTVTKDNFGRITNRTLNASSALQDIIAYKTSKAQHGTTNTYTTPLVSQMECRVGSTVKSRYIYEYDVCGNITSISDNGTLLSSYEYDGLNRLIRENNVNDNTITLYYYNNGGNITEKRIYSYSTYSNTATNSFLNIAPKKTIVYGYAENGQKDRLLSYNGTEDLTYDSHGNPRQWFKHVGDNSYIRLGLSWSKVNRLTEITDTDSNEKYEYTYDYNGIRTSKKVGNTLHKYYLDGSNIIAETRTVNGVVNKLKYYYGTMGLVGFNYNGTDYYYQKNIQGDIVRIYNNSGTLYGEYRYDAWGKCTIITDINGIASINPFRYRGYYLDNETGLCYLNSRYYDPAVGRFLSPDSLEYLEPEDLGGLNLYSYCNNNPVMSVDPDGTEWWHWLIGGLIVGALIAATIISAGSLAGGLLALGYAANGIASASLATTVFSFAAVGAGTVYAASAIVAGIYSIETWINGGSFLDGVNTFMGYGETAMWSTLTGGVMGGIGGYISYREQIGNSSQAGFMTRNQRVAQRRALMKADAKNLVGKQISHIYGTYGNNRNYYIYQTPAEHRAFHAQYGYKTNGGPFNRINPNYHNWWIVLKMIFGL